MHEMSIAIQVVEQVVQVAEQNGAKKVDEVELEIGVMQQVVHEALELAFSVATEGTLAEDAKLTITEKEMVAICRDCDTEYKPGIDCYICPNCQQANARINAGNEIILKSVICQTE